MALVLMGGVLIWGWPGWIAVVLGLGSGGVVFGLYQANWRHLREQEERIQASLQQLQKLGESPKSSSTVSPQSETIAQKLQNIVGQIQSRIDHLEEEQAKIVAIVENLVEGVVAFDPKGQVLFSNSSLCRMLGLDATQLQGKSVWEVIRNKELAELVDRCQNLPLNECHRAEIEIHAPAPMTLEVYGLPFPLAYQKKGSVIVLHDITQLRRLEQVRAEFIDNVSHELRTPLAAIVGYLETLIDEPSLETPNNRKFVHIAHQHAGRLNRLVNDLRSLSEIESGKVVIRCVSVPVREVVEEVCDMFHSQVSNKQVQISNEVNEACHAWADRDRIIQILVNVVDNALKYTSHHGSISFQAVPEDGDHMNLRVQDTGQGIPSTDLPRITERFYRVDPARSREEGGTGLGLSIVKHLVQLLGGQLRIQSELGKGTTVEVVLPTRMKEPPPGES